LAAEAAAVRESAIRRSRIEADFVAEESIRRSRIQAELEADFWRRYYYV
jgi:hypothetical protein